MGTGPAGSSYSRYPRFGREVWSSGLPRIVPLKMDLPEAVLMEICLLGVVLKEVGPRAAGQLPGTC